MAVGVLHAEIVVEGHDGLLLSPRLSSQPLRDRLATSNVLATHMVLCVGEVSHECARSGNCLKLIHTRMLLSNPRNDQ
jgi:hypothetical protein